MLVDQVLLFLHVDGLLSRHNVQFSRTYVKWAVDISCKGLEFTSPIWGKRKTTPPFCVQYSITSLRTNTNRGCLVREVLVSLQRLSVSHKHHVRPSPNPIPHYRTSRAASWGNVWDMFCKMNGPKNEKGGRPCNCCCQHHHCGVSPLPYLAAGRS